jgi:hypothetical protein
MLRRELDFVRAGAATLCPLLDSRRLMYLSLAGRHGWPTVQRLCLPVPLGIRVPQWALVDVTVRC